MTTILCIEDEADIRQDIVEELRDAGYETLEAADGKEGLQAIREHDPDLVLCDITMPVMNGHEVLATLRQKHPEFAETPFVFLTALAQRDDVIAGRKLGVDDYLTKPIDYELLLVTVESRLQQAVRFANAKREQVSRLYRTLMGMEPAETGTDEPSAMKIVTVAAPDVALGEIHDALEATEIEFVTYESGRAFLDKMDEIAPDVALIAYRTADLLGPDVVKRARSGNAVGFPMILVIPPEMARVELNDTTGFDDTIRLPCERDVLMEKINRPSLGWEEVQSFI